MTGRIRVELFFDVISPYSWIGFEGLTRYRPIWKKMDLHYRPFYFAGVLKESENKGAPMLVEAKEQYLYHDLPRSAKHFGMELVLPPNYKNYVLTKSSVKAQRLLLAIQQKQPKHLEFAAREMWKRVYLRNDGIYTPYELLEVIDAVGISKGEELLKASETDAIKLLLRKNSEEALAAGCFGAPWIHVHTPDGLQKFFGSDRLPQIADSLGEQYLGPNPSV